MPLSVPIDRTPRAAQDPPLRGELPPGRRFAVLLNPRAGGLKGTDWRELATRVTQAFAARGHSCEVVPCPARGLKRRIAPLAGSVDAIIVGGGDGTIRTVAGVCAGTRTAVGIIPLGTMNLLARELGLPLAPLAAVEALAGGRIRQVDIAEVDGHRFLHSVLLGVLPVLTVRREALRHAEGLWPWLTGLWAMLRDFSTSRKRRFALEAGDTRARFWARAILVANNRIAPVAGYGITRAALDDGTLAIYVARHRTVAELVPLFARAYMGNMLDDPQLEETIASGVTITTSDRRVLATLDGELRTLRTPLVFRVLPRALSVIVPAAPEEDEVPRAGGEIVQAVAKPD